MSTVRGPLFWYFDGAHRNLTMVDSRSDKRWTVPINVAPGFENPEVLFCFLPVALRRAPVADAGPDRLAGTRVVVWQFATRELSFGDWKPIVLSAGSPGAR